MPVVAGLLGIALIAALLAHFNYLPCSMTKLCEDIARSEHAIRKEFVPVEIEERKAALKRAGEVTPAAAKTEKSPAGSDTDRELDEFYSRHKAHEGQTGVDEELDAFYARHGKYKRGASYYDSMPHPSPRLKIIPKDVSGVYVVPLGHSFRPAYSGYGR